MKYTTILFDLDNTILDFYDAEKTAFYSTSKVFDLSYSEENYVAYRQINQKWWNAYEKGLCEKKDITTNRFRDYLAYIGKTGDPALIHKTYVSNLSLGKKMIDGAYEILEYFKNKGCTILIVTNGVATTQYKRLEGQPFLKFIDGIYISDEIGYPKPKKEYFDAVQKLSKVTFDEKTIIVGDSLTSDIQGGINIGIDTCYFNFQNTPLPTDVNPTYIITKLTDLIGLFE
ncbi:MAG: YjjG family noncanonical pyrimidine nucleotidase [Clostridia bacterium]|nr:YjjG family noncanonical pyrimidine nucleotidase [Clostridia bacterium]